MIEMLIVITIMAILATFAYPSFTTATENADENVHRAMIRNIRIQIELYQVHHGGSIPNLIQSWDEMTKPTIYKGRTYGPYLSETPMSHKRSNVLDGLNVDPPERCGFVYDYRGGSGTGMIWATNGSGKKLYKW